MIKAILKNYRQSPRKVRLVADVVRGKNVNRALSELNFLDKKAAPVVKKLIDSAVANAKHNFNIEKENLIVEEIRVDEGTTLKRWRAGARGRAFPLKKRSSHIFVGLATKEDGKEEKELDKKSLKKESAKMEKKVEKKKDVKVKTKK